jgi:hypothetical protein
MERYNHMGAIVADAVLQARNKYKATVKPRVDKILAQYPHACTTSSVLDVLQSTEATDFLNWKGVDRAERFCQVIELFKREGVEAEVGLQKWLLEDSNLPKLRAIIGIGPKTVDYFKILVGISTSAIDRHLINFLGLAGLSHNAYTDDQYADAQSVINAAADILGKDRACFDHSIWLFMSEREVGVNINTPEPSLELLMQQMQKILDNQNEIREDIREIKALLACMNAAPPKPSTQLDSPA